MAKIYSLKISNFRGVKSFYQVFGTNNLVCLIGRGDSGKTTILHAISFVLSPSWNLTFYDTDFYNGEIDNPIEIEATLYNLPKELLTETKFGLHKRILINDREIVDDLTKEDAEDNLDILTIRLTISKDLEPKWEVVNQREDQDPKEISAADRAKLNAFIISDYFDRHFSWTKGNPLYSLLRESISENTKDNTIIEALRKVKSQVDANSFEYLDGIIKRIEKQANEFGLDVRGLKTSIDLKDINIRGDKVCLHDSNIPIRQRGKGSKRLLSMAIQTELIKAGGIVLIDEIEQGLEPDRVRFLVNRLKNNKDGQIFLTTHSSNVVIEVEHSDLFLVRKGEDHLTSFSSDFQGCIRNNPEAFFSTRILLCEGATEVGICRSLNNFRMVGGKESFAVLGICIVDGTGSNLINYALSFKKANYDVCLFCDSDVKNINDKKDSLKEAGIVVVDCATGNNIEQQLFHDLPWFSVQKLIEYAIDFKGEDSIKALVENQYGSKLSEDWINNESANIREALGKASTLKKKKENGEIKDISWFKRTDHGEFIGTVWFNSIDDLRDKTLLTEYENLSHWISHV